MTFATGSETHLSSQAGGTLVAGKGAFFPATFLIGKKKHKLLVDQADAHLLDGVRVYFNRTKTTSYVAIQSKDGGKVQRLSRLITGAQEGQIVDHINGNPLDNRRKNLRLATSAQNNRNRAKAANKTSCYKGVSFSKSGQCWAAVIYVNYKQHWLGQFKTEVEAAHAYDAAARKFFGEFAALNFPLSGEQPANRKLSKHHYEASYGI